jgi:predicted nucleotide-binding protein (sugar kinase/HSP70/actin superfamily)
LCFLDKHLCANFNFFSTFLKNLGLAISSPSEVTKKDFIPKSIPTFNSDLGRYSCSTLQENEA